MKSEDELTIAYYRKETNTFQMDRPKKDVDNGVKGAPKGKTNQNCPKGKLPKIHHGKVKQRKNGRAVFATPRNTD